MLNKYLIQNYDSLKEISLKIAGVNNCENLLHFVIEEIYKSDTERVKEIIEKKQLTYKSWCEQENRTPYWKK